MRTDHRHCQPFAVPNRGTAVSLASPNDLGGSIGYALAFIPALDFSPVFETGLVSVSDGHRNTEAKPKCPTTEFPGAEISFPKSI